MAIDNNMEPAKPQTSKLVVPGIIIVLLLFMLPGIILLMRSQTKTVSNASVIINGDVNQDNTVTIDDVAAIRSLIEQKQYDKTADLDNDGKVNEQDIQVFYEHLSLKR